MKTKIIYGLVTVLLFCACDRRKITRTDTETSGHAVIAGDGCFLPIIEEEKKVFTGLNPEANVNVIYTGEKELFRMLTDDSVRMIVTARELTDAEKKIIEGRDLSIRTQKIAKDGIALIIHKENMDSLINTDLLKKIMTGRILSWNELNKRSELGNIKVVFDHSNSSTLRFIYENITDSAPLFSEIRALDSNPEVINYVMNTPNALGVIGVNWISNPNDSTQLSFDESIRVMSVGVSTEINENKTYKPYPVFLNNGLYPLTRDVFVILTDLRGTLPTGFVKFIAGDAGQRIILKAGLVPATRPTREIYLKEDF